MRRASLESDQLHQFLLARSEPRDRLAATAARCAPADVMDFEQRDAVAALGKMQRGRAPAMPPPTTHTSTLTSPVSDGCDGVGFAEAA